MNASVPQFKPNQLAVVHDGFLYIRVPVAPFRSASGKSVVVASTRGNVVTDAVHDGKPITVGVNAYVK